MNVKKLILVPLMLLVVGAFLYGCKTSTRTAAKPYPAIETAAPCPPPKKPCPFTAVFSRQKEQSCPGVMRPCPDSPCVPGMVVSCEKYAGEKKVLLC